MTGLVDWDLHQDGARLLAIRREGEGQQLLDIDTRSGQSRILGVTSADARWHETVRGGGYVFLHGNASLSVRGVAARADTVFDRVGRFIQIHSLDPSPDGQSVAVAGWIQSTDSVVLARLDLRSGTTTELIALPGEGVGAPTWLSSGALLIPILESQFSEAWYVLEPGAREATRLGLAPRTSATYRFARSGLRGVAREQTQRSDVYVIRGSGIVPGR